MPDVSWDFSDSNADLTLTMKASPQPKRVKLWTARSTDKDFRNERWSSHDVVVDNDRWIGSIKRPLSGHTALFGELEFESDGQTWSTTTLVYRR